MATPNLSPVRVLLRSTQSPSPSRPPASQPSTLTSPSAVLCPPIPHASKRTQSPSLPSSGQGCSDGIVVVGFIGNRQDDLDYLLNRLLDSNVFGSGNLAKELCVEADEAWFSSRKLSYYMDDERGILYLQFCVMHSPPTSLSSETNLDFDTLLDDLNFEDLRGLLFMFCVCHVVIHVYEGCYFDPQMLKKLRVVQAAKCGLAQFVRSHTTRAFRPRHHSPSYSSTPVSAVNSLMTVSGSHTHSFPGQCIPVILFVFLHDFSFTLNSSSDTGTAVHARISDQFPKSGSPAGLDIPTKDSSQVVVLPRFSNKSKDIFKRKLQSSLEAQIRFLVKRCRILSGSESLRYRSRHAGAPVSAPLFSMDESRLVVLLEKYKNRPGGSLAFITNLMEEVLDGKASSDFFWQEDHFQNAKDDDVQAIQEFIHTQSNILKGEGGTVGKSGIGSAAGMGMVDVAAAATSAVSRKKSTVPQLADLKTWLLHSRKFLNELLSAKGGHMEDFFTSRSKCHQRNYRRSLAEMAEMDHAEVAVSLLEGGKGLNTRFSTSWCQKALPSAKDVYLSGLPDFYPTLVHEAHLEKALQAFCSMVKGPAVDHFVSKLKDECTFIWSSGRQQCDAVSLTGNPCILQRHDTQGDVLHSSGSFYLHACCCGRTQKLRSDPFDFESANNSLKLFEECDNILPVLQLPRKSQAGPIQPSSWSLVRIGNAKFYDSFKGLVQCGFCGNEKYLMGCKISLEGKRNTSDLLDTKLVSQSVLDGNGQDELIQRAEVEDLRAKWLLPGEREDNMEDQGHSEKSRSEKKFINAGKGFPKFILKRPFSEVVAGSTAPYSGNLQSQQTKCAIYESGGRFNEGHLTEIQVPNTSDCQKNQTNKDNGPIQFVENEFQSNSNSLGRQITQKGVTKHATIYVGFEHECPHGHRFLLNQELLSEVESAHAKLKDFQAPPHFENTKLLLNDSTRGINDGHGKVRDRKTNYILASNLKKPGMPKGTVDLGPSSTFTQKVDVAFGSADGHNANLCLKSLSIEDHDCGFAFLSRNLPIYMSCPHCMSLNSGNHISTTKIASTISQLQRIFMVTPPLPLILATCPIVQFADECLFPSTPHDGQVLQFSLGCEVILPPDSFITLRLPFIYGIQMENQDQYPLKPFDRHPELTAWVVGGTTLRILSGEAF